MIVVVDSAVLLHLIDANVPARPDPVTGERPTQCAERVEWLITRISRAGGRLIIPTPVLAEVLVHAGQAGPEWLAKMNGRRSIRIAPFDQMAAIECAAQASTRANRTKTTPRAKAKFDEQIVAVAIVEGATMICSDDDDIRKLAPSTMQVARIADLELPPSSAQAALPFEPPQDE